jgi:hypothetical protein
MEAVTPLSCSKNSSTPHNSPNTNSNSGACI